MTLSPHGRHQPCWPVYRPFSLCCYHILSMPALCNIEAAHTFEKMATSRLSLCSVWTVPRRHALAMRYCAILSWCIISKKLAASRLLPGCMSLLSQQDCCLRCGAETSWICAQKSEKEFVTKVLNEWNRLSFKVRTRPGFSPQLTSIELMCKRLRQASVEASTQ